MELSLRNRNSKSIFAAFALCAALIYYFWTPYTSDIYVFFGSAHLGEIQYGGGFWGAVNAWELKPIMNRLFIFLVYKISILFTSFENKEAFLLTTRIVYAFFIFAGAYSLSKIIEKIKGTTSNFLFTFLVVATGFFLISFRLILQAEYTATILSLFALNLLTNKNRYKHYTGITILAAIIFLKGISIIFVAQVWLILIGFFNYNLKQSIRLGFEIAAFCIAFFALTYIFYYQDFIDLKDATCFQASFHVTLPQFLKILLFSGIVELLHNLGHYPAIIPGLTVFIAYLIINKENAAGRKKIIILVSAWIVGYFAIIIQHKFFVYHFANILLPTIFSLVLITELGNKKLKIVTLSLSFITGALCFIYLSPLQPKTQNIIGKNLFPKVWSYRMMLSDLNSNNKIIQAKPTGLNQKDTVLYLEPGMGIWCWGSKTASRYYYPLPVQRLNDNPSLKNETSYKETCAVINQFKGKYILLKDKWFQLDKKEDLTAFRINLLTNYTRYTIDEQYCVYVRKDIKYKW